MSTKTTTTTTEAEAEDRQHVQGIGDDDRSGSGLTTGPMDWQQQLSVDLPCYRFTNSNTILSRISCESCEFELLFLF